MRHKSFYWYVIMLILIFAAVMTLPPMIAYGSDDISAFPNCPICGMSRNTFSHARMLIHYTDGSTFASCSLHCTALELAYRPGKVPDRIEVGDYATKRLLDAEQAVWVLGGRKRGVMTANAKWAFADKRSAQNFIDRNGGEKVDFETALATAFADMYADTRIIRQKRQQKANQK